MARCGPARRKAEAASKDHEWGLPVGALERVASGGGLENAQRSSWPSAVSSHRVPDLVGLKKLIEELWGSSGAR